VWARQPDRNQLLSLIGLGTGPTINDILRKHQAQLDERWTARRGLPAGYRVPPLARLSDPDPEDTEEAINTVLGMVGGGGGNILSFGRGLPNAARLQRAANLGYAPQTYYWAGTRDVPRFAASLRARAEPGTPAREAYILSETPADALARAGINPATEGARVMPLRVRRGQFGRMRLSEGLGDRELAVNLAEVRDAGLYDSTHILWPSGERALAVFNPRNIRSTNAQFDPRRVRASDLLAGIGAGGLVAAGAAAPGTAPEWDAHDGNAGPATSPDAEDP
jgi:hypothetical protein